MKNYKHLLHSALYKFHETQTIPIAINEVTKIFQECDQYSMIVVTLIEQSPTTKLPTLKEQIKIFGTLATIVKEHLINYTTQIMHFMIKKLKDFDESTPILHAVADTLGKIVQNIEIQDYSELNMLKPLYSHIQHSPQHSLCLTRIVQFLPVDILEQNALPLLRRFISLLSGPSGKVEILEGMAAIILSVEEQAADFANEVIPILPPLLSSQSWQIKKMALDVLYSLAVLSSDSIKSAPQFREITQKLKCDKIKQVRESALLVFNLLLDVTDENIIKESNQTPVNRANSELSIRTQNTNIPTAPNIIIEQRNNNPNTTEQKLSIALEAIAMLTQLIQLKGIADENELEPIHNLLGSLGSQPIVKESNYYTKIDSQVYQSLSPTVSASPLNCKQPTFNNYNHHHNSSSTPTQLKGNTINTNSNLITSRSFEYPLDIQSTIIIDDPQETFISKEAAEILREFREKQQQQLQQQQQQQQQQQLQSTRY